MNLKIQGKQISVGSALRTYVEEKIEEVNKKYFNHATGGTVIFAREGHGHGLIRTNITLYIGKNIIILGEAEEGDAYLSFDVALAKVAKQMRRYKHRLRDHKERLERQPKRIQKASYYTLSVEDEDSVPKGNDPVIIAEMTTPIETLSVSDAVMRLDLSGQNALLFYNAKHGEINMIYRRKDGNIGWIDPAGMVKAAPKAPAKPPATKVPLKTVGKGRKSA